jgi:Icc-related predicted phosphoesterase
VGKVSDSFVKSSNFVRMNNKGMCMFCNQEHPSFQHWGSKCLLQRILDVKPKVGSCWELGIMSKVHQFGHVHDQAGIGLLEGCSTVFVNAAMDLSPHPIVYNVYV